MNRNLLMPVAVSLILLSGCKYNDDNFEGLDDMTPTDEFDEDRVYAD